MNAPLVPDASPARSQLHARRCVRHHAREAAVRCPGCREFFCRECVVEHQGQLLCAGCLARAAAGDERRQQRFATLRQIAAAAGGVLALWVIFYALGSVLVQIPPTIHEGTVWKRLVERAEP